MSAFSAYLLGSIVLALAIGMGLYRLSVPPLWIGVGALIIVGFGLMGGAAKTKHKDSPQ
ncbi:hypothetical protein [Woodsholea maritima]|uniref:hypothetical protein n=1 Tax=Woodsholea maritima TaxID=240237 RepID=UPI000372EC40|nr:hypothetical protein [Woodsholea maritima]